MAAYNSALLTWFVYVLVKSPARDAAATLLQSQRWEQSLSDIHHPLPADSLIPMFEGMVDRALSRTQSAPALAPEKGSAAQPAAHNTVMPMSGLGVSTLVDRFGSKR